MRPDEHKKRKNTQYKKKHGMTSDEKSQTDSKNVTKSAKSERNTKTKPEDTINKETKGGKNADSGASNTVEDSDDYNQSYQKRKLVSNWSRYDDLPSDDDEDIPLQRGEDFSKLLAGAGGSAAQFRFKDEEDWSGEAESTGTSVLALDLEEIAKSVLCLPLHERLGIDQQVFTAEQLDEIRSTSAEYQSKYDMSHVGVVTVDKPIQNKQNIKQSINIDKIHRKPEERNKDIPNTVSDKPIKKTSTDTAKAKTKLDNNKFDVKGDVSANVKELASLEDDLDLLLSLDEPNKQTSEQSHKPVQYESGDKSVKVVANGNTVGAKQTIGKPEISLKGQDKGDNLEDWLDSMLDD